MKWHIRVPASVANLGPGFDILALAVGLENEVVIEKVDDPSVTVVAGLDDPEVLQDHSRNLVSLGYIHSCRRLAVPANQVGAKFHCINRIPMGRGLGSSAAALVAGVLAAHLLHCGHRPDQDAVLTQAATLEGHPENVAAALLGGLVICAPDAPVARIDVPEQLRLVFFVPETHSATSESRRAVPETFSRADAVFNAGRTALLVRAFVLEDLDALAVAMQDRWHQPYRARFFPATSEIIAAALTAGAYGASQSGAGSSVVALVSPTLETPVSEAMKSAAAVAGVAGTTMVHPVRNYGATFELAD
jgi:homoserine kinase